ncbi:MAG: energy-coupling factor transporter transmembrane protein EcfT [Ardenticatenales bacterium]|nr:energy-coupling factor transporter transmembrane protein EcfT [Ardenticatenales bacterium]
MTTYIEKSTIFHRLPLTTKLVVLIFYFLLIFLSNRPLTLLLLCFVIMIAFLIVRLPLKNHTFSLFTILCLSAFVLPFPPLPGIGLVVSLGKILCLVMVITLFMMTTKPQDLIQQVGISNKTPRVLHFFVYLITTTLAVLPAVQHDLQRALEAETLRRGGTIPFHAWSSWVTILVVLLARAVERAERLADIVIDRGYSFDRGLVPLYSPSSTWRSFGVALLCIAPGALVVLSLS